MTLPDERLSSLKRTRKFLISLLNPSETPRVPKNIRGQASACLKHFPYEYQLDELADLDPETYQLRKGNKDNEQ
jgi:hypothetical protein